MTILLVLILILTVIAAMFYLSITFNRFEAIIQTLNDKMAKHYSDNEPNENTTPKKTSK